MPAMNRDTPSSRPKQSLLSATSIVILSGFLIGAAVAQAVPAEFAPVALAAGCVGLVAWIGLSFASRRHRHHVRQRAVEQAAVRLERRIDRHIAHLPAMCPCCRRRVRRERGESQYLTVVDSRHWDR